MTIPLMVLAAGAAFVGLLGSPVSHELLHLLGVHEAHGLDLAMLAISTVVAALGVWLAWTVGVQHRNLMPVAARPAGAALYRLAAHKYFVDEWYDRIIIQPFLRTAERLSRFDLRVIDAAVDRAGLTGWSVGQLKNWFDQRVVDRLVNGTAQTVRRVSLLGRRLQTGVVHHYLLVLTAAVVVLSACLRWF